MNEESLNTWAESKAEWLPDGLAIPLRDFEELSKNKVLVDAAEWQRLKDLIEKCKGTAYDSREDKIGRHTCCYTLSCKPHTESCPYQEAMMILGERP